MDEDQVTVRDENRLIVAVAAGPADADLIARAPQMQHAIQRALERLQHETGAPVDAVIAQLQAARNLSCQPAINSKAAVVSSIGSHGRADRA